MIVKKNDEIAKKETEKADKIKRETKKEVKKYEEAYEEMEAPISKIQNQLKSIAKCNLGVSECQA